MGKEWLEGDMSFTLVLYKVDRSRTDQDDVYGEVSFRRPNTVSSSSRVQNM